MKIIDQNGYLELKRHADTEFPYLHLTAKIQTGSGMFTGENNGVMYGGGDPGKEQLHRFITFQANEVQVELTEGCWLELHRLPVGNIEVQFVISVFRSGSETSMSGFITVDGEYSLKFMEELWNEIA